MKTNIGSSMFLEERHCKFSRGKKESNAEERLSELSIVD